MSLAALRLLQTADVLVLALPVHTSDKLQPLDVSVFGPVKGRDNALIDGCVTCAVKIRIQNYKLDGADIP